MVLTVLNGYPGSLWKTLLSVLSYVQNNLSPNTSASSQQVLVNAIATTFRNGRDCFDANAYASAWNQEYALLLPILSSGVTTDDTTLSYVVNRILALQGATIAVSKLASPIFAPVSVLNTGVPVVSNPNLVEFLMEFQYETPPAALLAALPVNYPAAFAAAAQAQAVAWQTLGAALLAQGLTSGSTYDAVQRQAAVSLEAANAANTITVSTTSDPTETWNRLISMASLTRIGSVYIANATTQTNQQLNIARFVTCQTLDVFNVLLLKLRQYIPAALRVVTLRNSDTLVSLAARELGNFELWPSIAILNSLSPPYIAPIGSAPIAGLAVPGQQLFIPTDAATAATTNQSVTTQVPTYENNYLGIDLYLGPMSQAEMLPWTGDFTLISGYNNLQNALLRRLKTTLGSLVFHPQYGSRIPPEVGAVTTAAVSGYLKAYAEAAIVSDPRIYQVTSITATVNTADYGVQITATATPNGSENTSVSVNEVLQPNGN